MSSWLKTYGDDKEKKNNSSSWLKTDQSFFSKPKLDNLPSWLKTPQPKTPALTPTNIGKSSVKRYGGVVDVNEVQPFSVKLDTPLKQPEKSYADILNEYVDNGSTFSTKDISSMYADIDKEEDGAIKNLGKKAWGTLTYALGAPARNKFTGRALDTARDSIGGEGSSVDFKGNVLPKKDAGKVGNIVADIVGTGIGYSMPIAGVGGQMQSVNWITENALKPLELKALSKIAGKPIEQILTEQALNVNVLDKLPKLAQHGVNYGLNATKNALDFASGNVIQGAIEGKDSKEILNSGLNGLWQGAAFGTALKSIGDVSKSAFPGWKTTFENKVETPKPIQEVAVTKPALQGKFKVKDTVLEKAQNDYDEAVKKIQNYWGHWKLDEAEIKLGAEELGIDLDGILNNLEKAETNGINIRNIAEKQRMATVAGVNELPSNKLQNSLLQASTLKENTNIPIKQTNVNSAVLNPSLGATDRTKSMSQIVSSKDAERKPFKQAIKDGWENVYTRFIDSNKPIQKIGEDTYIKATNSKNVGGIVDHILNENLVDRQGNKIGESLKTIVKDIPKNKQDDFLNYVLQRHNIDRAREGKAVYKDFTSDESLKAVKIIEKNNPEYKALNDRLVKYLTDFESEWGNKSGLISDELWQNLQATYKNYVPTQRSFSELEAGAINSTNGRGFVDTGNSLKKATGSDRDIINPLENIMQLVNRTVRTAKYNEVGQSMLEAISKDPAKFKNIAEIIPPGTKINPNVNNIVTVLENGKSVNVQINNKQLLDALQGINKANIGNIEAAVKKGTNIFKALITTKNPIFAVRNIARDIPTAYLNGSEANPLKFAKDLVVAGKDLARNTEKAQRYRAVGGGGSNFLKPNDTITSLKELAGNLNPMKKGLKKVNGIIEHVNNIVESAPRLAEFNRVLEKTGDINKALYAANDVTTNFSRGGDITKHIDSFVPYLNAGVQGLDKLARQFRNKPIPTAAKGLIGITSATLLLDHVNKDNPKYQELDNRTKDNYFLIPNGDTFIKIPKSREYGVLFSDLFERVLRSKRGDNEAFKGFFKSGDGLLGYAKGTVATNFSPSNPFENNIFSPALVGLKSNKDFANRDIVPRAMLEDNRSKYLQYDEKTSEVTKWFAAEAKKKGLDLSPKQMDYLIRSYTGVIGQLGLPATTKATMTGNKIEKLLKPITSQFAADPLYSNQNITDFYDNYDKIKTLAADKNIVENRNAKDFTVEERYKGIFTKALSEISDYNKRLREAEKKNDLKEVKYLRAKIIEATMKANNEFKNYDNEK